MRLMVVEVFAFLVVFFAMGHAAKAAGSGAVYITVRIKPPDTMLVSQTSIPKPTAVLAAVAVYQFSQINYSSNSKFYPQFIGWRLSA